MHARSQHGAGCHRHPSAQRVVRPHRRTDAGASHGGGAPDARPRRRAPATRRSRTSARASSAATASRREAAARRAAERSLTVVDHGSVLTGDAALAGATLASLAAGACARWLARVRDLGRRDDGAARRGRLRRAEASVAGAPLGGRCQELALSAARVLAEGGDAARGITLLAAGTDGRDGPTDAAGAFADATVVGGHPRERPRTRAIAGAPRVVRRARRRRRAAPARTHGNKCEGCGDCSARVERPARVFPVALAFRLTQSPRVAHDHPSVHRRHHPGLRLVGHRGDARGERRARSAKPRAAARRSSASRSSSTRRTSASRRRRSASTSPSRSRARRPT